MKCVRARPWCAMKECYDEGFLFFIIYSLYIFLRLVQWGLQPRLWSLNKWKIMKLKLYHLCVATFFSPKYHTWAPHCYTLPVTIFLLYYVPKWLSIIHHYYLGQCQIEFQLIWISWTWKRNMLICLFISLLVDKEKRWNSYKDKRYLLRKEWDS
jgi:hypothetical protein